MRSPAPANRGAALLAAVVVALLLTGLSLAALGLARRDVSSGLAWALTSQARVALGSSLAVFLADTTRHDSLPRGAVASLSPLAAGDPRVTGTLSHIADSVYVLQATARVPHGATRLAGVRSVMLLVSPCGPAPPPTTRGSLCLRTDGGVLQLLP